MMKVRFSAAAVPTERQLTVSAIPRAANLRMGGPRLMKALRALYRRSRLRDVNCENRRYRGRLVQQQRQGALRLDAPHADRIAQAEARDAEELVEVGKQDIDPHAFACPF